PSQFINELPKTHIEWTFQGTGSSIGKADRNQYDFDQSAPDYDGDVYRVERTYQQRSVPKVSAQYPSGVKVLHALYGEGLVVESEGAGADEKILIKFKDGVNKRFMVKFAPLQRL